MRYDHRVASLKLGRSPYYFWEWTFLAAAGICIHSGMFHAYLAEGVALGCTSALYIGVSRGMK